jgi:hypothetical protein
VGGLRSGCRGQGRVCTAGAAAHRAMAGVCHVMSAGFKSRSKLHSEIVLLRKAAPAHTHAYSPQFKPHLIIALARGAVRHGIGAHRLCNLYLALGNERARYGGTQQVHALILRVGPAG